VLAAEDARLAPPARHVQCDLSGIRIRIEKGPPAEGPVDVWRTAPSSDRTPRGARATPPVEEMEADISAAPAGSPTAPAVTKKSKGAALYTSK